MTIRLTETQLRAIEWTHDDSECVDHDARPAQYSRDPEFGEIEESPAVSQAHGFSALTGTTPAGDELTLTIDWATSGDARGTFADLYDWNQPEILNCNDYPVQIQQPVDVLDDDGDMLDESEIASLLEDIADGLDWRTAALATLPECPDPEEIDIDEDNDMETITLSRDDDSDVRFTGEKIASASSHHYEGSRNIRWTELALYRTAAGMLICSEVGRTIWQGETDRHRVHVADDAEYLINSLGTGWLAKELYAEAGIECVEQID